MSGDKTSGDILYAGIAVCSIRCIQLILVASPLQAIDVENLVEKLEVEVAWYTEDRVNTDLMDTFPHVTPEGDFVFRHDGYV